MAKRRPTSKKQSLFLEAIARGSSVIEAAEYAGVGRTTPYMWAEDADFAARWRESEDSQVRELKRRAFELALGSEERPANIRLITFLLERYDRVAQVDEDGDQVDESVGQIEIVGIKEGEPAGDFITFVET